MSRNENASTDDVKGRMGGVQREGQRQRQVGGGGVLPFAVSYVQKELLLR